MKLVILCGLSLLIALACYRRTRSRPLAMLVLTLTLATMAAAMAHLLSARPNFVRDVGNSPGTRLAQSLKSEQGGGPVLVVRMSPAVAGPADDLNTLLGDLREELKGSAFTLVGLEDPPGASNAWAHAFSSSRPGIELFSLYLRAHPDAVALVSLVGLPDCTPQQLPQPLPALYIFGSDRDVTNATWRGHAALRKIVTAGL